MSIYEEGLEGLELLLAGRSHRRGDGCHDPHQQRDETDLLVIKKMLDGCCGMDVVITCSLEKKSARSSEKDA